MNIFNLFRYGVAGLTLLGAGLMTGSAVADIVHGDDVIINSSVVGTADGGLCVGFSCVVGESFTNNDRIRLKANNTGIHFVDSSSPTGVFPSNDWRIVINDNFSGGGNYFTIEDSSGGNNQVFRIDAGAPANALFVNNLGNIGLGTAAPARDLHILSGLDTTIRLEQDGSSGLTPQTWDIAGSNSAFFITDVTGGFVPFAIITGAPFHSLRIAATGRVGMGAPTPDAPLEVIASATSIGAGNAVLKLVNPAGPTAFQLDPSDDGIFWNFSAPGNNEFRISRSGTGGPELSLTSAGAMTITGTMTTGGGTCGGGCDRVFDEDYDLPTIAEHANQMWAAGYLPNVGPTPEGAPINVSDKLGRMLNELEKAHIYIARQQVEITRLKALEVRVAELEILLSR